MREIRRSSLDEVAAPGRPVRVPSSEESGAPGAEPGTVAMTAVAYLPVVG